MRPFFVWMMIFCFCLICPMGGFAQSLPEGWRYGGGTVNKEVAETNLYQLSSDIRMRILYGKRPGEKEYGFYQVPATTDPGEIVRYFGVGGHLGESFGIEASDMVGRVADVARRIRARFRFSVILAAPDGLKILFDETMTQGKRETLAEILEEASIGCEAGDAVLEDVEKRGVLHLTWSTP